jgi:hypothetical protein
MPFAYQKNPFFAMAFSGSHISLPASENKSLF